MTTIANTLLTGSGQRLITETTLTASDTFTYLPGRGQVLTLRNATAGSLTPVIDGDGGTTVEVAGLGAISVASGYSVGAIAPGAVRAIPLDTISGYLQGVIAMTGGLNIVATLTSY